MSRCLDYSQTINRGHYLNRGLVAEWCVVPWYASGPRFIDLSGFRQHGTLTNGPTWAWLQRPGGYGSLRMDRASTQYVEIADNSLVDSISAAVTVSAWIRPRVAGTTHYAIFEKSIAGVVNESFLLFNDNSQALFWRVVIGNTLRDITASSLTANRWSHVVASYISGDSRLYVDGVLVASSAAYTGNIDSGSGPSRIGSLFTIDYYASADLDSILLHNRALSAVEVAALYDETRRGNPARWNWIDQRVYSFSTTPATLPIDNRDATGTANRNQSKDGTASRNASVGGNTAGKSITGRGPN